MKASVKLREEEQKSPLLRAKIPISIFGFPLISSFSAGDPHDLSFHLYTSFPSFPSLRLSYHPNPNPHSLHPFSLSIKSGIGLFGSPNNSPLLISAHLSPNPPSFSFQINPHFGDFSFKKSAVSSSNPNPNPKENGGAIHHPIPMVPRERTGLEDLVSSGVKVKVRTMMPVSRRAGVRFRWGMNLPVGEGSGWRGRLPYLTVDKISIEHFEEEEVKDCEGEVKKKPSKEWSEGDLVAMKGMCFWMGREVEELQRENRAIKESIEVVQRKVSEGRRGGMEGFGGGSEIRKNINSRETVKEGRKHMGTTRDAAAGTRSSTTATTAAARR